MTEKNLVEVSTDEYSELEFKAEEYDALADWMERNLYHLIDKDSESPLQAVQRLMAPFTEPRTLGYVTFIATEDREQEIANVVCDGRLYNGNGLATQGLTVDQVLDRLKEVFFLYENEIAAKWGPRVLVEKEEYVRVQSTMAEEIDKLRSFLSHDSNVVRVEAGVRGFVVFLNNLGTRLDDDSASVLGMTQWASVPITYERA